MEPIQPKQDLKSQILSRIEQESVSPRSRWIYSGQECALWALWFLTAVIGALAVAVTMFVVVNRRYSFYEITHESFLTFVIEMLPYLWIIIFSLMVLFAVINLRQTKRGYRYPLWQIFGSSLILSLTGGVLLHMAGVGFILDHQMGVLTNGYQSQDKVEQKLWQQPAQGRLVGRLINPEGELLSAAIIFEDISGVRWVTNVSELSAEDIFILQNDKKVRLLGQMVDQENRQFYACAAFPWIHEQDHSIKELGEMREAMKKRLNRHRQQVLGENKVENIVTELTEGKCAAMLKVRKMMPVMVTE